jgi:hypothetical protein
MFKQPGPLGIINSALDPARGTYRPRILPARDLNDQGVIPLYSFKPNRSKNERLDILCPIQ